MKSLDWRYHAPRLLVLVAITLAMPRGAQGPDSTSAGGDRRFVRSREITVLVTGLAASGVLSVFDERIARWDQSSGVQGSSERHPSAMPWAAPLIYAAAAMPGLSRMYLDQHWASDVLAGDLLGLVIGGRLVHFAHSAPKGSGPGWLVNATVAPGVDGTMRVGLSIQS